MPGIEGEHHDIVGELPGLRERDPACDVFHEACFAQAQIARDLKLPPGYYLRWSGQFENLERAARRLAVVVPLAFFLIFVLLHMAFNVVRPAVLIFLNVPLAVTGGVAALAIRRWAPWPFRRSTGRATPSVASVSTGFIGSHPMGTLDTVVT